MDVDFGHKAVSVSWKYLIPKFNCNCFLYLERSVHAANNTSEKVRKRKRKRLKGREIKERKKERKKRNKGMKYDTLFATRIEIDICLSLVKIHPRGPP